MKLQTTLGHVNSGHISDPYEIPQVVTTVSLSRRNLVALLDALDNPLLGVTPVLRKRLREDSRDMLFVRAEDDDEHYADEQD
jgi:hypothetical protein